VLALARAAEVLALLPPAPAEGAGGR
jgi:hypothetical protein